MSGEDTARILSVFLLSLAIHALAWRGLTSLPTLDWFLENAPQTVEIVAVTEEPEPEPVPEIPEPEPEPEPEVPEPEPEPEPVVRPPQPRVTEPDPEPAPPEPEPPPVEETIADFTGETLTNEGEGWASAVGNGQAMDGPIGRPGAAVTGRDRAGGSSGAVGGGGRAAPAGPRVVALADLSRQPSPQGDMNAILQRNFPPRARQLGIEGRAVIGFRIMPDGSVARLRTRSESPGEQGFADACRRTVQQLRWDPPLARDGAAVATDAAFECEFTVGL
jgi:TonB family protein